MKVKYTLDLQISTKTKPDRFENMGEYDTHEEAWQAVRERVLKITGKDKLPNYTCYDLSPKAESTNFLIYGGKMYHFIITEIIIELDDDDE